MKIATIIIIAALAAFSTARARVGETEAQIEARYGKPTLDGLKIEGLPAKRYRLGGMDIEVGYIDGKSVVEQYSLLSARMSTPNTADPTDTILAANGAGKKWAVTDRSMLAQEPIGWKLEDGSIFARNDGNEMTVWSKDFADWKAAREKETENERLKGL